MKENRNDKPFGKIQSLINAPGGMKKRAAALLLALSIFLTACGNSKSKPYVPVNITPEEAITAMKDSDEKSYLYEMLSDPNMTFINVHKEDYVPRNFFELSDQFIEARKVLANDSRNTEANAAANDAIYGMNKLLLEAYVCNFLGIDPSRVESFSFKAGTCPEGYIRYTDTWTEEIVGGIEIEHTDSVQKTINLTGEGWNMTTNGNWASSRKFTLYADSEYHDFNLDHAYAAVIRALLSEVSYYEKATQYKDPVLSINYNESYALEIVDNVLEEKNSTAKTKSRK